MLPLSYSGRNLSWGTLGADGGKRKEAGSSSGLPRSFSSSLSYRTGVSKHFLIRPDSR